MNIMTLPPASFGKEVKAEVAVEQQHRERRREDRKRRDDQQIGRKRGPAEHRHAQVAHAPGAYLQHGCDQVDARHQRADTGYFERPQIVVDADAG
jgi:hypothetical protein